MIPSLPTLTHDLNHSLARAADSLALAHAIHQSLAAFIHPEHPWRTP